MQRREFITLISGAAASTLSLAAQAQQSDRVRRIGVLMAHTESDREFRAYLAAFREGLKRLGLTEGRDPVGSGFVGSLARPGGNATGFTVMEPTTAGKWLALLKEIAPRVNRATCCSIRKRHHMSTIISARSKQPQDPSE